MYCICTYCHRSELMLHILSRTALLKNFHSTIIAQKLFFSLMAFSSKKEVFCQKIDFFKEKFMFVFAEGEIPLR